MTNLRLFFIWTILALTISTPQSQAYGAKKARPVVMAPTGMHVLFHPKWPHTPTELIIKEVDKGSPADQSELKVGDSVIGINGKKFEGHPTPAMSKAIDWAEAKGGKLPLLLKSGAKVVLQLKNLGDYSSTAPYNCAKSDNIIFMAAEQLIKHKSLGGTPTKTGLLGLMATGEKKYLDVVTQKIKTNGILSPDAAGIDAFFKGEGKNPGKVSWEWGYNLIALGEYFLITQDESVLPAMKTYALGLARGQDAVGLWGHSLARQSRAPGYGIMNQPSLSCFMGLIFAKKCGIEDPTLDKAIEKTRLYVEDHIGQGGFPYGVHGPANNQLNNNGTSGSAAICMSMLDNQKGAAYFSRISTPTHNKLTLGHASSFFNPLWTPLGAALSGPEVTQKFFKNSLWYFNGQRHWKGGFPKNEKGGIVSGPALLMYCLPRKALIITGREADESIWIKGKEVDELINFSRLDFKALKNDRLFELLNSPYSQISLKASEVLAGRISFINGQKEKKPDSDKITERFFGYLKSGSDKEKILALGCLGKTAKHFAMTHANLAGDILKNQKSPFEVRVAAAESFRQGNFREAAFPFYNDILRFALEPRNKKDPFGHVDNKISRGIIEILKWSERPECKQTLTPDKELTYQVAVQFLKHKRARVRDVGMKMLQNISLEDFHLVADQMMHVLQDKDPGYHTYSSAVNGNGMKIFANLKIKEGLDMMQHAIFHGGGKWAFKLRAVMEALPRYGGVAEPYLKKFEAHPGINKKGDRFYPQWQKLSKKIRQDKKNKKLISFEEAKQAGLNK